MVQDGDVSDPTFSTSLRSSVLVTGALLVGTGDCTVVGNTISVGASIQTPSSGKISMYSHTIGHMYTFCDHDS